MQRHIHKRATSTIISRAAPEVRMIVTHLVTGTRRCDHITPVLRLLHWLPVCQQIDFKVTTLVHRSLSGNSASYLADDCHLVADARER